MALTGTKLNFKTSASGLLVPTVTPGTDHAVDVSFDIDLPGGTSDFLREDGTWVAPPVPDASGRAFGLAVA